MKRQDFSISIIVPVTPEAAFLGINAVTEWWTENLEGSSVKEGDEFSIRFGDVHYSKQRIIKSISGKKVVWLVTESQLNFLRDKEEWNGTEIHFDITPKDEETVIRFTHQGLVPAIQCYKDCSNAWGKYIQESLFALLSAGEGKPTRRA